MRQVLWRSLLIVAVVLCATSVYQLIDAADYRYGPAAVVQSGTVPWPAMEGALFLDTDASANGSIVCYSNGAWRTVQDLP